MGSDMQKRRKSALAAEKRAWDAWLSNPLQIGSIVEVTKDDGSKMTTRTQSAPWKLASGTPVVMVDGISGGYLLTRVRAADRLALAAGAPVAEARVR